MLILAPMADLSCGQAHPYRPVILVSPDIGVLGDTDVLRFIENHLVPRRRLIVAFVGAAIPTHWLRELSLPCAKLLR